MADSFVGSIKMMADIHTIIHHAGCNGSLLSVNSNASLFTLLGYMYGGSGNSFKLPDLRGRVPIHPTSDDPELKDIRQGTYKQGQQGGEENITLNVNEIPAHGHEFQAGTDHFNSQDPKLRVLGGQRLYIATQDEQYGLKSLHELTARSAGKGEPHSNIMPYSVINFQITLIGEYPTTAQNKGKKHV